MDENNNTQVERYSITPGENQYAHASTSIDFYTSLSDCARAAVIGNKNASPYIRQSLTGYNGLTRVHRTVNPQIEYEVPFYGSFRYSPGKKQDWTGPEWAEAPMQGVIIRNMVQGATTTLQEIYAATGEDFQAYFWTGLPPMYYESVPPFL
jgi:hypothetical protein